MATLAYIAGKYTFLLFGWDSAAPLAARRQHRRRDLDRRDDLDLLRRDRALGAHAAVFLLSIEIVTLALFAIVALVKVYTGEAPAASMHIGARLVLPVRPPGGTSALIDGVLLGVFIYWGWD